MLVKITNRLTEILVFSNQTKRSHNANPYVDLYPFTTISLLPPPHKWLSSLLTPFMMLSTYNLQHLNHLDILVASYHFVKGIIRHIAYTRWVSSNVTRSSPSVSRLILWSQYMLWTITNINKSVVLGPMIHFDDVLDPEKLRSPLETLLQHGSWQNLVQTSSKSLFTISTFATNLAWRLIIIC
jgi:hypothetical protein